jgi:hypothetical protein
VLPNTSPDIQDFALTIGLLAYLSPHVPSIIHDAVLGKLKMARIDWHRRRQTGEAIRLADVAAEEGLWRTLGLDDPGS